MARNEAVLVQLATRIPKTLHRELKLHCVHMSTHVMDFVTQAIEEKLARPRLRERASKVQRRAMR